MNMATAFILPLFDNSLFFIVRPIISPAAMASGDMEGIQPVLRRRSSPIFYFSSIKHCIHKGVSFLILYQSRTLGSLQVVHMKSYGEKTRLYQ